MRRLALITSLIVLFSPPAWGYSPEVEALRYTALGTLKLPGYELGARMESGAGIYTSTQSGMRPTLWGYRYTERGGIFSSLVFAGSVMLLGGVAASGQAAPTITSRTSSTNYNADGSRTVTTTTTGYVTAEQMENAGATLAASNAAAEELVGMRTFGMDLVIFDDDFATLDGTGDGYGVNINFWAPVYSGNWLLFELGLGFHNVVSKDYEEREAIQSFFVGMPLRLIFPIGILYFNFDLNLNFANLFFDDDETGSQTLDDLQSWTIHETRPWSMALSAHAVLWRFHLEAGVATSRLFSGDFGIHTSANFRF